MEDGNPRGRWWNPSGWFAQQSERNGVPYVQCRACGTPTENLITAIEHWCNESIESSLRAEAAETKCRLLLRYIDQLHEEIDGRGKTKSSRAELAGAKGIHTPMADQGHAGTESIAEEKTP